MSNNQVGGVGSYNVICPVCGWKYKASELKRRWDGLMVCPTDWESRHPLDFFRTIPDQKALPFILPDFEDVPSSESGNAVFNGISAQFCRATRISTEFDKQWPMTCEFWYSLNTLTVTDYAVINNSNFFHVFLASDNHFWFFFNTSPTQRQIYKSTNVYPKNAWTKVEFTCPSAASNGTLSCYDLSGALLFTETIVPTTAGGTWASDFIEIGNLTVINAPFVGWIDEVRLWNVVRTPAQLEQYRFQELNGGDPNLYLYLNFDAKTVFGWNNLVSQSIYKYDQGFKISPQYVSFLQNTFMRPAQ